MGIIVHFVWSHTLHKCLSFERIAYISRYNIIKKSESVCVVLPIPALSVCDPHQNWSTGHSHKDM